MEAQSHMASQVSIEEDSFFLDNNIKQQITRTPCGSFSFARINSFANMNPVDDHESTWKDEKVSVPGDLLDESWFFGNLLHRKTRMSRCYSDPCPSSNYTEEMLAGKSLEETFSLLQKLPAADGENAARSAARLIKAPSLPEESSSRAKRSHRLHRGNSLTATAQTSANSLCRAPSLPSSIGREEIQDEESDFSMSRLIRQASLKQSDSTLPPRHLPKSVVQGSSSTPRHRPRRKPDLEFLIPESPEGMIRGQQPISRSKLTKSSSDVVFQELQGLKDMSIKFDKTESGPDKDNKIVSMQEKKRQIGLEETIKRSSSGESWQAQKQNMDNGKKSVEDMKAQIRFWARAVASNVRQEC